MTKVLAVLPLAMMTVACVPAGYPRQRMPLGYAGGAMYGPAARYQPAPLPIGRWDNVMMLGTGTSLQVLMMDGGIATGRMVAADSASLRLRVASGEVELASEEVMRIDRVDAAGSAVRDGAKGAAFGAGFVGVLGLMTGHVPPARVFAAGGIAGAYHNAQLGAVARGASTIYLAPAVAPVPPAAAQWTPRGVPRYER
jgi:hypothetical protein